MAERRRDSAAASLAAMRSFTLSAALSASALMRFTSSCRQHSQSLYQEHPRHCSNANSQASQPIKTHQGNT